MLKDQSALKVFGVCFTQQDLLAPHVKNKSVTVSRIGKAVAGIGFQWAGPVGIAHTHTLKGGPL